VNGRSYLDAIVPDVRRRLAERKARVPLSALEEAAAAGPGLTPGGGLTPRAGMAPPGGRFSPRTGRASFAAALRGRGLSAIAEVKRFSPSKGPIRPDLDIAGLVAAYEAGGAAAVSVLTEEDHFCGGLQDLRTAAEATALPLLRKDFIVDPYQLHEARAFGASAVLLIAALLDDRSLHDFAALAHELGLDVLLEVHDAAEMARALRMEGALIGVNNRDLRTFEVSLEASLQLAGMVPADRVLVAESGIKDRTDAERLASAGVDAVLVGESLLRQSDAAEAVSALVRPTCAVARRYGETGRMEEAV
jgi:indole-3-glycerol phosphate synthase